MSRRSVYLFVFIMSVQGALTVLALADDLRTADRREVELLATAALAWVVLAAGATFGAASSMVRSRRAIYQQAQAIATTEALTEDWVWEADLESRLTYCNDAVRAILGYQPSELLGKDCSALVHPDALPGAQALVEQSIAERGTPVLAGPLELPWLHADGHTVLLQGSTFAIYDERGVAVGYRGTRRVMTEAMVAARQIQAGAARVSRVLAERALDIALQPIIDLTTGRIDGVEAMARFKDGRTPDTWFAEAAEAGLALELDRLTFLAALELFPLLPQGCHLSINATPELLTDRVLLERLVAEDVPGERLIIEITEHVRISSYQEIAASLAPLRERGIRLAVDDTGAGFASLNHVLQLRPDIIKIDRSLVSHVTTDAARRSVITSLVLLALDLGASVTAEGVETASELETITAMGADNAQGFLLARPTTDPVRWGRWWDRDWLLPASERLLLNQDPADLTRG